MGEFDEALAPIFIKNNTYPPYQYEIGYEDGESYWHDGSSYRYIRHINVPLLQLSSQDDFLIASSSASKLHYSLSNPNVMVVNTRCGGHLGWHESSPVNTRCGGHLGWHESSPDTDSIFGFGTSWADTATTAFIDAILKGKLEIAKGGEKAINFSARKQAANLKSEVVTFSARKQAANLFLFLANFTNAISLSKVGISLTSTSKCGIPLITVLLTLISDGREALPSALTITTLIPIAVGIGAAAWNSPTFDTFGFLAAMVSCTAQSLLNVTSKKAISKTGVSGAQAQRAMVTVSFAMTAIYSLVSSKFVIPKRKEDLPSSGNQQQAKGLGFLRIEVPALLTSLAVAAYHLEYNLSFMFVKLVAPITYGTCDAIRRLSTIVAGHIMFGETKFSRLNIFGIGLAMLGALAYSFASNS
eukprot:CAMPEP_0178896122 /NCGR_PEP_ID=MMETSP0786-20121207/982_1 /TAXON_ID=186022 /ORGANISM="Thalassionema frauenfeldii, Strain CCMP 1798" /LENGTH=414 /DNA_ID=CAMNT_0020566459 /DNA_START=236 /DNA_END=1479 /DNA_ORIENTATION=+